MEIRGRLAMTLLLWVVAASAPASLFAQAIQRSLYVSVLDDKGTPIPGLGPADFLVREDNVAREILRVAPASDPMLIALLVDNSQATGNFIRDYRQALPPFIDAVTGDEAGARNLVSLVGIGERPTILADYTANKANLNKGVQRLFAMPGSGTYLLDGIIEVSQGIKKRQAERAVIVALTSEGPELSGRNYQTVLDALHASGAAFHVIVIGSPVNRSQDRQFVLSRGTDETGGRYDNIFVSSGLDTKLKQVAAELTGQYRVTYARPQSLIPPERVKIETTRAKATARGIAVNDPSQSTRERR
jgi:VWFA-related protein